MGARVLRYLRNTLRERSDTYITTFFDLYGLRRDFPGFTGSLELEDPIDRAVAIETEFQRIAVDEVQCRTDRFFPHIQPYEFEALLFSDVSKFGEVDAQWKPSVDELMAIRESVQSPEYINDGQQTHPSARLEILPGYRKVLHGTVLSQRIGLDRIRNQCRHFDRWLAYIENLPPLREAAR